MKVIKMAVKSLKLQNTAFQCTICDKSIYISTGQDFVQLVANYESITYIYSIPKDDKMFGRVERLLEKISLNNFESKWLTEGMEND